MPKRKRALSARHKIKKRIRANRPLHRRVLLHPAVVFLLLGVGVLLLTLSLKTSALTFSVTAKVPAPPLTEPAVIQIIAPASDPSSTTPTDGATTKGTAIQVTQKRVTLTGECPKTSHIEFYRNGDFAGVTACIGDPTFSIELDLVEGINKIEARVFNITDDQGPTAVDLYINYIPPATSSAPVSSATINTATAKKIQTLLLSADFNHLGFATGDDGTWNINVSGGTPPYILSVVWGDGSSTTYPPSFEHLIQIDHTYTKASTREGYPIKVEASDTGGQQAELEIFTIISAKDSPTANLITQANAKLNPSILETIKKWLWLAWPGYLILALMSLSFWLGEWEEYKKLSARLRIREPRPRRA